MSGDLEERLDAVYHSGGDRGKLDTIYDDWARDYDQNLWASGNPYIALMIGMVGRHVPDPRARILDGGCGTGNLAQIMSLLGHSNIVGIDPSDGMLEIARSKNCYAELHNMLLGSTINLPEESFDAVTAAGVLTHGHAPPESLDGMLTLAKPGAPIIFSISQIAIDESGFGEKIASLERSRAWVLKEKTEPFRTYPFSEQYASLRHWICVYTKT